MSSIEINHNKYSKTTLRNPTTINGAFNNEIYLKVNNINANTTVPSNDERAVLKKTGSTGVGEKDSNGKYHIIEYLQKFTETVNGVDVNLLGNEEQDANGNKYYKINKINDDNSKNISVTESDGTGSTYSGPPHFNYIEEWKNHDSTTIGILKKNIGNPTYEYTQHNGKPGIMGYGWHHSLKIENISKVDSSILVLDKIVEGDDDGIWKWFLHTDQGWQTYIRTQAWGQHNRYHLNNQTDGRLVNYRGYNDGPYLPYEGGSRDGTNGWGYGHYIMSFYSGQTAGDHTVNVKDRYYPLPSQITSEERAGCVMVLYSPEACPNGYDHTKIHMVGSTLNEIKVHLRNPKPGKRIYFFRGGWHSTCAYQLEMEGGETASDQQYKSIWHELITFSNPFQVHDKNYYIGDGSATNQFTTNDSLQSTAAQLHGLTTLNNPSGNSWGATTLQNPSFKNCDSYGYAKITLMKILNDKWGVNPSIQRETFANGKSPLLDASGNSSAHYSPPDSSKTAIENGIDQYNQWFDTFPGPNGIQETAHLDAGKMATRTNAQRYIYPNSYISVNEDANTVTFYTSIFDNPTFISDSDNSALISGLSSTSTNNLTSGKSNKVLSNNIINKIKELIIDAVISNSAAKTEKRRKTFKQILNNSSSNVVQINNSDNTYFKNLFSNKLKSNITSVKVFQNNQTIILSGSNTDLNTNESFYSPLDNNEYIQVKIDDSNEIKITRVDNSDDERYQLELINGTPDIFKIGNTATNLNIDANNKYVSGNGGYLIPDDTIIVHGRKIIIGSVTDGGAVTSPEFTNITPSANSLVNTSNVGYTLSGALTSGTITFTRTGGVADSNSPHTVQLTGNELNAGVRSLSPLTNAPSLVAGAIYSMKFSGSSDDGPVQPEPVVQNITFDNTAPTITNLQPAQDSFIMNANIGYQLSENLASGKVKFKNTTDGTEQEVNLTGDELNSGVRNLAALTNAPTLIHGKTYTIEINGSDAAGNAAATASVTGLKYEVPSSKLTSLNITDSGGSALSGFTFNQDTLSYNLLTKSSTVNISYQEVSANIDPTTVKDNNGNDIPNISPLTLTTGNNIVKITITSKFAGTSPITYTIDINLDDVLPIISNVQPAQDSFISNANIGYELSEQLASGKVKFINTTDSTEEEVNLTGNELNSGVRSLAALTNAPTLTHNKTYNIQINGTDLAGNVAATAGVTGLKYEVPSSELDSLTISELQNFSFVSTTENYNLTYNGDSINVTYQAKSNNVTITVKDGSNADISSLTPLTLNDGDNVVKIIVASNFSGTPAKTYTVTINKPSAADKVNNSLAAAGLDAPSAGSPEKAAVDSLSNAEATSFYSNDTVKELPNSVTTAIQGVSSSPTKVKALMQKILLECATNNKTIDIDKPIELPIDTFSFATANLPANPPAKISVIPPSSQPISLDSSINAIYVPLSVGEDMNFKLTYPTIIDTSLPNTQNVTNYNIKFSSITDTQFTFTLPAGLEAHTTVKDGGNAAVAYNSSNHSTLNNGAVVNINGNVIIMGSVLFGGNDGSGSSDPYTISNADKAVLTTGLDSIAEEAGRGNLKIKPLNATMNAKLKELIVDSSDSAEVKRKKRDNLLYIILNHANMGSSTAIKVPKSDLGFTEMSQTALNVVVFKTSSSATVLDVLGLNNDEAFYAPLSKNSQFSIDLGSGTVPTFVRADEVTEKYTLTVTGTPKLIKKTGCNDLILNSNNHLVSGHLVPGDVLQIANRIFFMGMLGDGGQSIILEYANVAWTNVYNPNTTSFEDNIAAANPSVPLQSYNRDITINGVLIPAGELKFVRFTNGSKRVNFSN